MSYVVPPEAVDDIVESAFRDSPFPRRVYERTQPSLRLRLRMWLDRWRWVLAERIVGVPITEDIEDEW